ncbi:Fumarate reductase flavoprotein subunit precursor [Raoultella ornithinolytica]|nr:Fumarate reductase flavoprotein subunit precursor [Raoultella ornithinolytica]
MTSASSPRELAEKLVMDYHAFLATLERYNGFVENQRDEEFGRTTALRAPVNQGPFHAIRIAPGVHHTMGGVTINTDTGPGYSSSADCRRLCRGRSGRGYPRRQPYRRQCRGGYYYLWHPGGPPGGKTRQRLTLSDNRPVRPADSRRRLPVRVTQRSFNDVWYLWRSTPL